MPFRENMVYVRWEFGWQPSGSAADIEIQDFGIWGHIGDPQQPPFPGWQNVVDGLSQRCANAWIDNMEAGIFGAPVHFRRCVAYHYDQAHENVLDRGESPGTSGTWQGGNPTLPPQTSLAVSLYTFQPGTYQLNPGRHRGRFYLPTPSVNAAGSDGELAGASSTALVTDLGAFFADVTGTFDNIHMDMVVNSVAGQFDTDVTWYRLGRIFDTQRRRRNKLPEAYVNTQL